MTCGQFVFVRGRLSQHWFYFPLRPIHPVKLYIHACFKERDFALTFENRALSLVGSVSRSFKSLCELYNKKHVVPRMTELPTYHNPCTWLVHTRLQKIHTTPKQQGRDALPSEIPTRDDCHSSAIYAEWNDMLICNVTWPTSFFSSQFPLRRTSHNPFHDQDF